MDTITQGLLALASSASVWKNRTVKKPTNGPKDRPIKTARINDGDRLIFEGPLSKEGQIKPVLFIHNFCEHDKISITLNAILKISPDTELDIVDLDGDLGETKSHFNNLGNDVVAFAKTIPPLAFIEPERIDAILSNEKSNILLTTKQLEVLYSPRPLLLNGQAGTGKTTILCHRLAHSLNWYKDATKTEPILYLSYNNKLVEQAKEDVGEIMKSIYSWNDPVIACTFIAFQEFLKKYCYNPDKYKNENKVTYGKFKLLYENYRRGNPSLKKISPELAWHVIRSIMKGACEPPIKPPLPKEQYIELSKKRREVSGDLYDSLYSIGLWYQEKLHTEGLWDDLDLAWEALKWIKEQQNRKIDTHLWSEIFCDEVQDLTEIEFSILVALCRPPVAYAPERILLSLGGDPLQTINPTGFRWSVVSDHVYKSSKDKVTRYELKENWRSDKKIVELANKIQEIRSFYTHQVIPPQEAFEKEGDGDVPFLITMDSEDECSTIESKFQLLSKNLDKSAIIVLEEDDADLINFVQNDKTLKNLVNGKNISIDNLNSIMAQLNFSGRANVQLTIKIALLSRNTGDLILVQLF